MSSFDRAKWRKNHKQTVKRMEDEALDRAMRKHEEEFAALSPRERKISMEHKRQSVMREMRRQTQVGKWTLDVYREHSAGPWRMIGAALLYKWNPLVILGGLTMYAMEWCVLKPFRYLRDVYVSWATTFGFRKEITMLDDDGRIIRVTLYKRGKELAQKDFVL